MVRSSKPTASATPAVSNVVVEAPVAAATPKKSASKKVKAVEAAPAPVVAAPVAAAPAPVEVAPVADVVVESTSSSAKQLGSVLSTLKSDVKVLAKTIAREQKIASKSSKGNRKVSASRKPSGFIKPTLISDELAKFLGKNAGTEMARTDVSKEINMYIRTNNLQDKENGRKIHPDAKLSCLLNIKPGDEPLTYFNLQRFMKHHFVKTEVAATA